MRKGKQAELVFVRHGGRRTGAGRKPTGLRRRVAHTRRPEVHRRYPQHVTLRVLDCVGRLRKREVYQAVRAALLVIAPRESFRVVHMTIQSNHLHLICEADNRRALTSGISALKISAARRVNAALGREGTVFADRYHAEPLGTPTQVRNCLNYVFNNWRRHGEDRRVEWPVDYYSSAVSFPGWKEGRMPLPSGYELLPVSQPRSWLLSQGWKRASEISCYSVPGPLRSNKTKSGIAAPPVNCAGGGG